MWKKILVPKVYLPIVYLLLAIIFYRLLCRIVDKTLVINKRSKTRDKLTIKREATIINLIKSIIKYIVAIIVLLAILNVYGVKTTSIIASLGVAGAIIGLAFQDIIKNLLAGFSIIFDNHYMQGDIVTINGFRGEVIELGLQTTKIKSYTGEVMIINNNLITSVINHSMFDTILYLEIPVSKNISLEQLETILKNVNKRIEKLSDVTDKVLLLGIETLNSNNYVYKVQINCKPDSHFGIKREYMKYLKEEYDLNKVEVPAEYLEIKNK